MLCCGKIVLFTLTMSSCVLKLDEHLTHLTEVLRRLCKASVRLKPKKCMFLHPKVQYLGHVISQGVSPDPEKEE